MIGQQMEMTTVEKHQSSLDEDDKQAEPGDLKEPDMHTHTKTKDKTQLK